MSIKASGIANILFSKAQQRILTLLYGHPDQSFYTNAIIRFSKLGTGAIQRELEKLSKAELVIKKRIGNQTHYQANNTTPFFNELRSITLKSFGLADVLRTALKPFQTKIFVAFIYGSIARQEDNANSDIDLMLLTNDLSYADLFPKLQKIESTLGRTINPTLYSLKEWEYKLKEKNPFVIKILAQPKIFLAGSEDDINRFK